jgi:hypothetical protein
MTLLRNPPDQSYDSPTLLICNQCGLIRVADNYHQAKDRAELHCKLSKHYTFELAVAPLYDRSPS